MYHLRVMPHPPSIGSVGTMKTKAGIELRNVSHRFGNVRAVDQLLPRDRAGQTVALLGAQNKPLEVAALERSCDGMNVRFE